MEYRVVEEGSASKLAMVVSEALRAEWEPIGGVAIGVNEQNVPVFAQAMVRKQAKKKSGGFVS